MNSRYKKKKVKRKTTSTSGKKKSYKKKWFSKGGKARRGMYKGYWCDSSWELAFIMWCLDHDITIERNTKGFPYIWYKKKHYFFPDFVIDGKYYEIKGVMDGKNKRKIASFEEPLKVLDKVGIQKYLDYAVKNYGSSFWNKYDN